MSSRDVLLKLLDAASLLSGTTKPSDPPRTQDVAHVLLRRLRDARNALGEGERLEEIDPKNADAIQEQTALFALEIVEKVQAILDVDDGPSAVPPLIGTRHLAQLKTLISIIFKWAVEQDISKIWSTSRPDAPRITEVRNLEANFKKLLSVTLRLFALVFRAAPPSLVGSASGQGGNADSSIPQTHITQSLVSRHATDILRPAVFLGWMKPLDQLPQETVRLFSSVRANADRLMNFLPASQSITSLGIIMSPSPGLPPTPPWLIKACSYILSRQLMRPDGVRGLFSAIFGDEDGIEEAPLTRLEYLSKVLIHPPSNVQPSEYFRILIPRLLAIIASSRPQAADKAAPTTPVSHRQGAAFTISRLLTSPTTAPIVNPILLLSIHSPFYSSDPASTGDSNKTTFQSLASLTSLLLNMDPSPTLISSLLSPIFVSLYSLHEYLSEHPGAVFAEPGTKDMVEGLLRTWARTAVPSDAITGWWKVIQGSGGWGLIDLRNESGSRNEWTLRNGELVVERRRQSNTIPSLTSFLDPQAAPGNPLQIRPDPVQLVKFLKAVDRKEVSGALLVRCLDEYSTLRQAGDAVDPLRVMMHLNIVLEMVEQLGSAVLRETEHILGFIAHALQPPPMPSKTPQAPSHERSFTLPNTGGLRKDDLRIIDRDSDDEDDEDEGDAVGGDDMAFTAVNLLLSILEGDPDLTSGDTPLLQVIFSHLELFTNNPSGSIRKPALEARLIITARAASSATVRANEQKLRRPDQEIYQDALKLLQDPILPVRAYGLLMLRQLVVPPDRNNGAEHVLDQSLVPAILDIFMQSVQDDDSFVFLNAVQGLSAMVHRLGRDILYRLVDIYTRGAEDPSFGVQQNDLDKRLRIGEALGQVIRRCGDALPIYAEVLVPPMLRIFRSRHVPAILRASSLSILALCAETSSIAIIPWSDEMAEAAVDLIQLESVPFTSDPPNATSSQGDKASSDKPTTTATSRLAYEDSFPALATTAKTPAFRRAALHFLALLIRAAVIRSYTTEQGIPLQFDSFSPALGARMVTIVQYVHATDQDGVVRAQAGECVELLEELRRARLGL